MITSLTDGSVRAVLDWELCTLGDPLADLGGLLAYWPQAGDPAGATGRSLATVGFWPVLGLWKLAIIAEGVLRRDADEPQNASSSLVTPKAVDDLLIRAEAIARETGI